MTEYIGLDQAYSAAGNDADVIGDSCALPFDNCSFDTVIATQVIEHVAEPRAMVAEIARVLRPGGVMLITAPFAWPLHEAPHDFQRFTRYGLEHIAVTAGLTVEQIGERGGFWMLMAQLWSEYAEYYHPNTGVLRRARPLLRLLRPTLASAAEYMDRRYPTKDFTLGYALVARKKTAHTA